MELCTIHAWSWRRWRRKKRYQPEQEQGTSPNQGSGKCTCGVSWKMPWRVREKMVAAEAAGSGDNGGATVSLQQSSDWVVNIGVPSKSHS